MNQLSKIEMFWQDYLSILSEVDQKNTPRSVVDKFADAPEAATLVRDWIKTTPSSLYGDWNTSASRFLKWVLSLIVDGNGEPLCIIELAEVEIKPFNAVDERFAFEYGEGDRTLASG